MPRTHHSPLPFPLPPRSARLPKAEETGGKSWLLPTVNTEKGRVAFGMKGGGLGQQDTTRPNTPPALPQLPPAPAEPVPSLRGCFGLREPPLHDAPPLLISLMAQEQRQGLRPRNHFTDPSKESLPLPSPPSQRPPGPSAILQIGVFRRLFSWHQSLLPSYLHCLSHRTRKVYR